MQKLRTWTLVIGALLSLAPAAHADTWTFGLIPPSGAVTGFPGTTVGWGYTIENQSATQWLMLTGLSADVFSNGTPTSVFDFPILAPLTTVTVVFDFSAGTGLYALTWDATAPVGFVNSGTFVLNAEWWDDDPLGNGNFVDFAQDQSAAYSATVAPVPEPMSALLVLTGLGALALRRKR